MSTIRLFIAIELPDNVKGDLVRLQSRLKREVSETVFRWLRPENIHLTLVFLGEVPTDRLAELGVALKQAGAEHAPFQLRPSSLGGFPNLDRPRVLWAGLSDPSGTLHKLHKTLGRVLLPVGFPPEARPYTPHLSLAYAQRRAAGPDVKGAGERLNQLEIGDLEPFKVGGISLIRSQLSRNGPIYSKMAEAELVGMEV
jgi:RNA 2',3'-cyclic 3'-phosphodiesterase